MTRKYQRDTGAHGVSNNQTSNLRKKTNEVVFSYDPKYRVTTYKFIIFPFLCKSQTVIKIQNLLKTENKYSKDKGFTIDLVSLNSLVINPFLTSIF
jgi:hypothetical protein